MRKQAAAAGAAVMIIAVLWLIPVSVSPPPHTRIIIDRTNRTYIAPPCFDQAGATNNIAEITLGRIPGGYKAESACTEGALRAERKPLLTVIPQWLGLTAGSWDWS